MFYNVGNLTKKNFPQMVNISEGWNKNRSKLGSLPGGSIAQWLEYLLLDPAAPGSIPSVAEVNQERRSEKSGQWL